MDKRERLQRAIAGESVDRPPVALWGHWPVDDRRPETIAEATIHFQREWDWDFVKVTPWGNLRALRRAVERMRLVGIETARPGGADLPMGDSYCRRIGR
ncbi:MAG: uroporphyrinogen decarboxylase family protein [Anaerolineae bacterium]|nr:uroporphyrinogen decarboxylase family protein [Anaerolineae bacterium]